MYHSLQSCGKLWHARYCYAQECPTQEVILTEILDSNHLPIVLHLLDHVRTRNLSGLVDKFTDWEWLQSLASELIWPVIKINFEEEATKAALEINVSLAYLYMLPSSKFTRSEVTNTWSGESAKT
jgi:hypothetical protein